MSSEFDCPYPSSESSEAEQSEDSERPERPPQKKHKGGQRPPRNECKAWFAEAEITFEYDPTLPLEARTNLLKERIKDRLSHEQPDCVYAYEAHVDSKDYSGPDGKYSFPITFYIQTRNTTKIPLQKWLGDDVEVTPMKGGLCGNDEYDNAMKRPAPWVVLRLFSTIKLNNAGRAAKKVIVRYFHCVNFNFYASSGQLVFGNHFSKEIIAR